MVAVMGASGHIGGRISDLLLAAGEKVRALGRSAEKLSPAICCRPRRMCSATAWVNG